MVAILNHIIYRIYIIYRKHFWIILCDDCTKLQLNISPNSWIKAIWKLAVVVILIFIFYLFFVLFAFASLKKHLGHPCQKKKSPSPPLKLVSNHKIFLLLWDWQREQNMCGYYSCWTGNFPFLKSLTKWNCFIPLSRFRLRLNLQLMKENSQEDDSCCRARRSQPPTASSSSWHTSPVWNKNTVFWWMCAVKLGL